MMVAPEQSLRATPVGGPVGDREVKLGPSPGSSSAPDPSTVALDDPAADGQPDARAGNRTGAAAAFEQLEQLPLVALRAVPTPRSATVNCQAPGDASASTHNARRSPPYFRALESRFPNTWTSPVALATATGIGPDV